MTHEAFWILAENKMNKEELVKLSKAILLAQDIREKSWDETINAYHKTERRVSEEACKELGLPEFYIKIVWDLIFFNWNDSQGIAESIINKYYKEEI